MNPTTLGACFALAELTVVRSTPHESAALIMLAASLLVFRTFRERYLLVWILGWLACFVSRWTVLGTDSGSLPRYLTAISQAEFVLAICLFAGAVFIYSHARKFLLPLVLISVVLIG